MRTPSELDCQVYTQQSSYYEAMLFNSLNCVSIHIITDLIYALPGNSSVYTVQHATIDEAVFLCRRRRAAVEQRGFATRF
jgi:hypothetical protein